MPAAGSRWRALLWPRFLGKAGVLGCAARGDSSGDACSTSSTQHLLEMLPDGAEAVTAVPPAWCDPRMSPPREAEASPHVMSARPSTKLAAGPGPSRCYGEPAAGRHEGFGAIPSPTRTHDQMVTAPLTMSTMGPGSPSSRTPISGWGTAVLGKDLPPRRLSSVTFYFCWMDVFGQSGELLGVPSIPPALFLQQ